MAEPGPAEQLVIGAAVGQTTDQIRPFLTSLRRTGYAGDVVLFVDPALERRLRGDPLVAGVTLIKARQWLPFRLGIWQRKRVMRFAWTPFQFLLWIVWRALGWITPDTEWRFTLELRLASIGCTPMEARFFRFRRFLAVHPHRRVLISDVRDVLFQNDPFTTLPDGGLAVSLESSAYTISTEDHNAAWIWRAYGSRMLEQIGSNHVSCVGVTYGDRTSIATYLKLMTDEILRLSPSRLGVGGADTAVHNYLLWTGRLESVHYLPTLESPVATLNGVDDRELLLSTEGRVLNRDRSEPSVLHQYDRLQQTGPRLLRALAG